MTKKQPALYFSEPYYRITFYFILFGFFWILLSDRALNFLYPDPETAINLQTYKGLLFIFMTAVIVFFTSRIYFRKEMRLTKNLSKSEALLKENEKLNEILLRNIPNTDIYLFDKRLQILKASSHEKLKNQSSPEWFRGEDHDESMPDQTHKILEPVYLKTLAGESLSREYHYKGVDYMLFTAPVYNSEGIIHAGVLVSQNVTELKKAQKELAARNIFIETILNNLPLGVAVNDNSTGKGVYMNNKFEEIYGWPLKNEDVDSFFNKVYSDPDYRQRVKEMVTRDISSGNVKRMVWENIHITTQNGYHRIISARNIPIKEQDLMVSLVSDVTENRKAERQIIESRNRFRAIFEHSPFPIWEEDFSQVKIYIESLKRKGVQRFEEYLDERPEELTYMSTLIQIVDVNRAAVRLFRAISKKQLLKSSFFEKSEDFSSTLKSQLIGLFYGKTFMEFNHTIKNLEGDTLHLKLRVTVSPGHEDDYKYVLVSVSDVTDITLTQKKLEEEKHKADIAIESSGLGYWEADYTKNTNIINDQWARILEYEKDEISQTFSNFLDLVHPDDLNKIEKAMNNPDNQISLEVRMKTKSEKWKWISINGIILERDSTGKAIRTTGTHRDLSFERDKEKELLKSFIEGKDRERKRMARELHDSLGQSLTAASLSIDFIMNNKEQLSPAAWEHLSNGQSHLKEAIEETRNISHDLLPRTVEDFGLIPGIRNLVSNIQKTTTIKLYFFENIGDFEMSQEQELHIYRIVQEAVNNSLKHSECSRIDLQLIRHDNTLTITIEDNGKGFNKEEIEKTHSGFGLRNIEIRSKALSGEFSIESAPGKGTTIIVELEIA